MAGIGERPHARSLHGRGANQPRSLRGAATGPRFRGDGLSTGLPALRAPTLSRALVLGVLVPTAITGGGVQRQNCI
eukprot:2654248-Lingulodinium_polyedra.AAC.1